jgi:hypothetical protein
VGERILRAFIKKYDKISGISRGLGQKSGFYLGINAGNFMYSLQSRYNRRVGCDNPSDFFGKLYSQIFIDNANLGLTFNRFIFISWRCPMQGKAVQVKPGTRNHKGFFVDEAPYTLVNINAAGWAVICIDDAICHFVDPDDLEVFGEA